MEKVGEIRSMAALSTLSNHEIDILVAEKILEFRVEKVYPSWYNNREVILFLLPNMEEYRAVYSFDNNSCNAMMYRNGVDGKDGIAPPLPSFSSDISEAWSEVLPHIRQDNRRKYLSHIVHLSSESAARAICIVALVEKGFSLYENES